MNSEDPYRLGRAYERRCEINGLIASAKVFVLFLVLAYPISQYAPLWAMIVLAVGALNLMSVAYVLGSIFTPWREEDEE